MVLNSQIESALDEYCKTFQGHNWQFSTRTKKFQLTRPDGREIQIWHEGGKFRCSDREIGMILMEMASAAAVKAIEKAVEKTAEKGKEMLYEKSQEKALENVQAELDIRAFNCSKSQDAAEEKALVEFHRKKARTYKTENGEAPTAAMVNRNANRHRLCTEVLEYIVTDDLVRAKVRVTDPITGQYKEDGVAFTRNAFVAKKTVDIISKHIKKNPDLVVGIDPITLRPELSDTAKIYDVPAKIFIAKEVLKSWNFLGRFAITTAERRCQDKLLNAEWREREEIELERAEIEDVAEAA